MAKKITQAIKRSRLVAVLQMGLASQLTLDDDGVPEFRSTDGKTFNWLPHIFEMFELLMLELTPVELKAFPFVKVKEGSNSVVRLHHEYLLDADASDDEIEAAEKIAVAWAITHKVYVPNSDVGSLDLEPASY